MKQFKFIYPREMLFVASYIDGKSQLLKKGDIIDVPDKFVPEICQNKMFELVETKSEAQDEPAADQSEPEASTDALENHEQQFEIKEGETR